MSRPDELLSLWVGPQSQELAHHFYSLQAEQFFDQEEDPTNQHALWTFRDKYMQQKHPRMIVFDTVSDHLTKLRKVNLSKMIKKIQQPTKQQMYFHFQYLPKQEEQTEDPQAWLFQNWQCSEDNYTLIDTKFHEEKLGFDDWQGLYQHSQDHYEDRVRKQLERTDSLRVLLVCSDSETLGFSSKLIEYLRDECPKKSVLLCSLSDPKPKSYFGSGFLPLLGTVIENVDILVDFDQQQQKYEYFENSNFYAKISPLLNSLVTPFILKDIDSAEYIQRIDVGNRPLFNLAYTLPIINEQSQLSPATNIFQYLPAPHEQSKHSKNGNQKQEQTPDNRINWVNSTYLNITAPPKPEKKYNELEGEQEVVCSSSQLLCESFVIKGSFQNLQKMWSPRVQKFSFKYLQGILSVNPSQQLKYSQFYRPEYGETALQYPFHTVLFQHAAFGPSIRNFIRRNQRYQGQQELLNEWKQSALALSDLYGQQSISDRDY